MKTFQPHLETLDTLLHNILKVVSAAFALLLSWLVYVYTILKTLMKIMENPVVQIEGYHALMRCNQREKT